MNRLNSSNDEDNDTPFNRFGPKPGSNRRKANGSKHSVTNRLNSVEQEDQLFRQAAAFAPFAFGFFSNSLRQR